MFWYNTKVHINFVELRNFRNYSYEKFILSKNINILLGDNAQGKTNLLESIYFSCLGKSFKTKNEKELIKYNSINAHFEVNFEKNNGNNNILVELKDNQKYVKLNEINVTKLSSLIGNLACVFFSPNELKLVKEAPEDRRKFMDIALSQLNREYYNSLIKYNKILKERNKLLKSTDNENVIKETLPIWDYQLVKVASLIIIERLEFVKKLNIYADKEHKYLSDDKENLLVHYHSCDNFNDKTKEEIEKILLIKLDENKEKDLKLKYTSIGPHRDDLKIYINNMEVKSFGSQGQQRTALLSIKLAEVEIFKEKFEEYPILLLDDVFSELDENRKLRLFEKVNKMQTIITTTKFDLPNTKTNIIKIENGKIVI
ncbi:MAG: DNA replication/repair protein RecF [Clostridiales bacterium]|nr:DNA replication/repair protein RecF [Clostridiales bacterium]